MKLPIRWAVVKELHTQQPCIMAKLVHDGKLYETANVMPRNYTPAMAKLVIAAMTAEFVNAVGGAV